jgi:hypothetical protein
MEVRKGPSARELRLVLLSHGRDVEVVRADPTVSVTSRGNVVMLAFEQNLSFRRVSVDSICA